jgi:hypothetical protein
MELDPGGPKTYGSYGSSAIWRKGWYLKEALQVCAVPAALGEEAGAQRADDGLLGGQEAEQVARSVPQRGQGESAPQVRQAAQEGGQVPLHTEKKLRLNIFKY